MNMMDNKENLQKNNGTKFEKMTPNLPSVKGELIYEDKVIEKIVGLSLDQVDGLLSVDGGFFSNMAGKLVNTDDVTSGVDVEIGKKQVAVDLNIVAEYRQSIPRIYDRIKEVVSKEIDRMTNLELVELNVKVVDIKTQDQQEKDETSLQDHLNNIAKKTGDMASGGWEQAKTTLGMDTSNKKDEGHTRVK